MAISSDLRDKGYFCEQLLEHRCRFTTHTGTWDDAITHDSYNPSKIVKSPIWYSGLYRELEWQLRLYPNGDEHVPEDKYVSIHPILIKNNFLTPVRVSLEISLLDYDRDIVNTHSFTVNMKEKEFMTFPMYSNFLELEDISFNSDYYKSVHYSVTVNYEESFIPGYGIRQMFSGFEPLLRGQKYCDVTLVSANGVEIPAHKIILAGRSPVFAAMFEHDLAEQKSNIVKVDDLESHILEDFLMCLYTCRSKFLREQPFDWMSVCKLMCAADKYQVLYLKEICAKILETNLCLENVCVVLKLADLHDLSELKKKALDFVKNNYSSVILTPDWTNMLQSSPDSLLAELDVGNVV